MDSRTALTEVEYSTLSGILQREYGVDLDEAAVEVIRAKLERYRERRALSSVAECISDIVGDQEQARALGDIIYSQSTHFNRHPDHFEFLVDTVLLEQRGSPATGDPLSIWCLGCSTGQEPYTIAIYLMERVFTARSGSAAPFRLTAADCSPSSLRQAKEARYARDDVKRLEPLAYAKYFVSDGADHLVVGEDVRQHIEIRPFNLVTSAYVFDRQAEYVFMRNAINFHTRESKRTVLHNLHHLLKPGGYLVLGDCPGMAAGEVAECGYEQVRPGCYRSTPRETE